MRVRRLITVCALASAIVPAAAQQQTLPRPGQAPPVQQQLGRPAGQAQQPAQPQPPMQQLGRQPSQAQPPQGQPPQAQPPQGQPAQVAPPAPYKPVAVTLATPYADPGLAALRKQIEAAAQKKDRAALGRLIVAKGFFWFKGQGDGADGRKSGLDNLAAAIDLFAKDGSGWETLASFASDETAEPFPDKNGVVCSPAGPQFNEQELEEVIKTTQTDVGEWAYTLANGTDVRAQPQANAPVIEKLGLHFVRVMFEDNQAAQNQTVSFVRVVTPSGKVGYVSEEDLGSPDLDQVCYVKEANGAWKIIGLISAGED